MLKRWINGQLGRACFLAMLCGILYFSMSIAAAANTGIGIYREANVVIDGQRQSFTQPALLIDGRTMVPMRAIFEKLGADISWDGTTRTVTATKGSDTIIIEIGGQAAKVNGRTVSLDVAARIVKDHTMVPLRFVSEALGATVTWDAETTTAIIVSEQAAKARPMIPAPIEFDYAGSFSEGLGLIGVWEGMWKYGYINGDGEIVIQPQFNYAENFQEGLAVVGMGSNRDKTMKYGYINKDGTYVIEPQFDAASPIVHGYGVVTNTLGDESLRGIVDANGRIVAQPQYSSVDQYDFQYGYAAVRIDDRYGVVDLVRGTATEVKYDLPLILERYVRLKSTIDGKEKFGMILHNGKIIEPKYDWIHHYSGVENVLGMVEIDGKFGLIALDGRYILEPKYDEIRNFGKGVSLVKQGDLYGWLRNDGTMLTKIEYEDTASFSRGKGLVKKDGKWGVLNIDGTYLIEPKYDQIHIFEHEIEVYENGIKKILNFDGDNKFDPYYEYLYPYESIPGASKVKKNGKEIIIDSNGKPIFDVDFDTIGNFENDVARITLNGKDGYLKRDGSYLVEPIYDSSYKERDYPYYNTRKNGLWGLVHEDGTTIAPAYSYPIQFFGEYGIANLNNKYLYIDHAGNKLTEAQFEHAQPVSDGIGRVGINSKIRYVKMNGELLPGVFDNGFDFSNGYALVYLDGKYRFIDTNGNFVFDDLRIRYAKPFSNGLAAVMGDKGKFGFINTSGQLVIDYQYDWAFDFGEKLAPIRMGDKFGYIDQSGQWVIEPVYDMVDEFQNGVSNVWRNGVFGYIDSNGMYHDSIVKHPNLIFTSGIAPVRVISAEDDRYYWGYLKSDGRWLLEPEYSGATEFEYGIGYVFKDGKRGQVSETGDIVWE